VALEPGSCRSIIAKAACRSALPVACVASACTTRPCRFSIKRVAHEVELWRLLLLCGTARVVVQADATQATGKAERQAAWR